MSFLSDFIFFIYSLFYLPFLLVTRRWHKDFIQRLGVLGPDVQKRLHSSSNIWVHAVSVGEVGVIEGLISQLKLAYPQHQIVITVTTKTGYELAQKRLAQYGPVLCSPLDFSWVVKGFIHSIKPRLYIAAETEIWPNLFSQLDKGNVPIVIINGRISDKSFPRYQCISFLLKNILSHVRGFCMQSDLDAKRMLELGAPPQRVKVTGNLKFDDLPKASNDHYGFNFNHPLWICGSTHPGEEEIILGVFQQVLKDHPSWQLVIAPRHIERSAEVIQLIETKGMKAVRFSKSPAWPSADSVVVIDTIGHLRNLYALASLVFVGKSLRGGGGQNIIEPAFFAKPIIVGPKMENFRDITACFRARHAIVQIPDSQSLEEAVRQLMEDPHAREELGKKARGVIDESKGALQRTMEEIKVML
jgi:3-deoxy-D-manno-octulosonic-acid transferase